LKFALSRATHEMSWKHKRVVTRAKSNEIGLEHACTRLHRAETSCACGHEASERLGCISLVLARKKRVPKRVTQNVNKEIATQTTSFSSLTLCWSARNRRCTSSSSSSSASTSTHSSCGGLILCDCQGQEKRQTRTKNKNRNRWRQKKLARNRAQHSSLFVAGAMFQRSFEASLHAGDPSGAGSRPSVLERTPSPARARVSSVADSLEQALPAMFSQQVRASAPRSPVRVSVKPVESGKVLASGTKVILTDLYGRYRDHSGAVCPLSELNGVVGQIVEDPKEQQPQQQPQQRFANEWTPDRNAIARAGGPQATDHLIVDTPENIRIRVRRKHVVDVTDPGGAEAAHTVATAVCTFTRCPQNHPLCAVRPRSSCSRCKKSGAEPIPAVACDCDSNDDKVAAACDSFGCCASCFVRPIADALTTGAHAWNAALASIVLEALTHTSPCVTNISADDFALVAHAVVAGLRNHPDEPAVRRWAVTLCGLFAQDLSADLGTPSDGDEEDEGGDGGAGGGGSEGGVLGNQSVLRKIECLRAFLTEPDLIELVLAALEKEVDDPNTLMNGLGFLCAAAIADDFLDNEPTNSIVVQLVRIGAHRFLFDILEKENTITDQRDFALEALISITAGADGTLVPDIVEAGAARVAIKLMEQHLGCATTLQQTGSLLLSLLEESDDTTPQTSEVVAACARELYEGHLIPLAVRARLEYPNDADIVDTMFFLIQELETRFGAILPPEKGWTNPMAL